MTEEQAAKASAQRREFPETMEIMGRIRAALAERLFKTAITAKDEREDLFLRVQAIDAMTGEMQTLLAGAASEAEIAAYVESLATTDGK